MGVIVVDPRFNGLPDIALGGYVGGVLARGRAKAEVTLRRPIRIGKPYQTVAGTDGTKALEDGNDVLALVRDASVDLQVPRPVGLEASMVAAEQYMVIAGTWSPPASTAVRCDLRVMDSESFQGKW